MNKAIIAIAIVILAGCGSDDGDGNAENVGAPPPIEPTIFETLNLVGSFSGDGFAEELTITKDGLVTSDVCGTSQVFNIEKAECGADALPGDICGYGDVEVLTNLSGGCLPLGEHLDCAFLTWPAGMGWTCPGTDVYLYTRS